MRKQRAGFTLIEAMIVVTIIGILASLAIPAYKSYVVQAEVTEGINLLTAQKAEIATFQAANGRLPTDFKEIGWPAATTTAYGGPAASFQHVFGYDSDIWRQVEYQPKSGGYVMVLRSYKKPRWDNIELAPHLQIKSTSSGGIRFRCVSNLSSEPKRAEFMPSTCGQGSVTDWSW